LWQEGSKGFMMPEIYYKILNKLIHWRIPFLGYPLSRSDVDIKPFFIVGSGRSGNTLLRRVLLAHSELYIPPETYVLGRAIKTFQRHNHLRWKDLVFLTLSLFEFHPEFVTFECSLRPLADQLAQTPSPSRNLANILDNFYRYHAEIKGFHPIRWGDKTPLNVYDLPLIKKAFPKAQFIHIVRDGCDVVESYLRSGIYEDLEAAGERWRSAVQAFAEFSMKNPASCYVVRYEDLVRSPRDTVEGLCDFLEIEFETQMLDSEDLSNLMGDVQMRDHHQRVSGKITSSRIGKGRELLKTEEKKALGEKIDAQLIKLGYDPCIRD
jgi:protein-tyrosine sulfotransferase